MVAAQSSRAAFFFATVILSAHSLGQQSASHNSDPLELAQQLADPQPEVRLQAFESLQAQGIDAFDALYPLQDSESLEQRLAVRRLLQSIEPDWTPIEIPGSLQQILADYRRQSAIRRKVLLERIELSKQPEAVIVLANLARFERSPDLSCQAAICLIRHCSSHQERSRLALDAIGSSPRKSCAWIRDALGTGTPGEFSQRWISHLQNELYTDPQTAGPWQTELMFQLLEWTLPQLVERNQQAAATLISAQCAQNCPKNLLGNFADLFIRIQDWEALDELAERNGDEFNHQPILLYRVASGKLIQGETASAYRLIKRAGQIEQTAESQLEIGIALRCLGYSIVAEQVLNLVSLRSDCPLPTRVRANLILAQWLSQNDRNSEAVERIDLVLAEPELQESECSVLHQLGSSQQQVASQKCLYEALARLANNDLIGGESQILAGLQQDPGHTELLILGHRFQFSDSETNDLVDELVELRQQELLQKIAKLNSQVSGRHENNRKTNSNRLHLAVLANRFAWLTANTAGDIENALRYARLANELVDRNPYYLDTEAKCCFVLGEITRAIELQTEACRSGTIHFQP